MNTLLFWKKVTAAVLLTTTVVLIGYDIAADLAAGSDATISWVIYTNATNRPALAFAAGFLNGHLFWVQKPATK